MTERFHLHNVLIIQSVPYLNLGSPRQGILTRSSCGSALSTFLFSSDKSGHGAEAVGQGRIQGSRHNISLVAS